MKVTRKMELDYAHVLPKHFGFCSKLHGHRGVIEATFSGDIKNEGSSTGMIEDFKILKTAMMETIHAKLDHCFAVWKDDTEPIFIRYQPIQRNSPVKFLVDEPTGITIEVTTLEFVKARNGDRVLVTDEPPTAEYLAKWCFKELRKYLSKNNFDTLRLDNVRFYETPNNWADYSYNDFCEEMRGNINNVAKIGENPFAGKKHSPDFIERHNIPS